MFVMIMHPPGRAKQSASERKNLSNVLKRGAGESDQTSRAIDAMALSTPRQPASRGLDDPGMGGVPPAAGRGQRIASLHDHSLQTVPHQPCAGHSRARDYTMAPRGGPVPVTAGGLKPQVAV